MRATVSVTHLTALYSSFTILTSTGNVINEVETKIIGGQPVDITYRPFMLSLHNSHGFVCGASILSRKWGITALHCLISVTTSNYYVRAGTNELHEGGSVHRVTRVYAYNETTYPYWFSSMLYHDMAIFKVRPRFRFSETIGAVRLPNQNSKPPLKLYVCGWGYTVLQSNARISDTLMGVSVRHVPFEACSKATPEYATLVKEDYHVCYGTRGKDSCYGDSGGPLASRNTIYGVVSFGQNCGIVPGVYGKVSYYRRWIKEVTNL